MEPQTIDNQTTGQIAHRLTLHFLGAEEKHFMSKVDDVNAHSQKVVDELTRVKLYIPSKQEVSAYLDILDDEEVGGKKYNPYVAYGHLLVGLTKEGVDHVIHDAADVLAACPHLDRGHYNAFVTKLSGHKLEASVPS